MTGRPPRQHVAGNSSGYALPRNHKPLRGAQRPWFRACVLAMLLLANGAVPARGHGHHGHGRASSGAAGQFDYYLLVLSWSPSYCLVHPEDRAQCMVRGLGFVLHGLWPQYEGGGYPQDCASDEPLTPQALQLGQTLMPTASLARHEWERHGRCTGLDSSGYFQLADRALAAVQVPASLAAPNTALLLPATQIAAAFRAANPRLPPDGLAVDCHGGEISDLRFCLTRDLKPRACGRGVQGHCPAGVVRVPAVAPRH